MRLEYFKNENTLNIFCDASIIKVNKDLYRGCYGACAVYMDQPIDEMYRVASDTTNNNSEIKAVRNAVSLAIKYKNKFPIINIFSDSQVSIFGVRDRIFNWKNINGTICGFNNTPIANQSIFVEIVDMVISSGLYVNFWHQKGHVELNKQSVLENAAHVFQSSNGIRDDVPLSIIRYLSYWNDIVDNKSRDVLHATSFNGSKFSDAVQFSQALYFYENLDKYESRINTNCSIR